MANSAGPALDADRRSGSHAVAKLEQDAHSLADRLPDLLLEADRISSTVAHGIHGRRRAGPGETFWQFRHYSPLDAATLIDWRRSASSDQLYVREREWEAAHTLWLWPDLSPSMNFKSHLSRTTKRDRAIVLMLACSELLVRSGERVGLMGVTIPMASRKTATKLAEAIAMNSGSPALTESLPPEARVQRFSSVILFSDFLDPIDQIRQRVEAIASAGVTGHIIQVLDPAEETLPYQGRTEFLGLEGSERWLADRAESLREAYIAKFKAHRASLFEMTTRLGWSMLTHHTDHPAAELLLSLMMNLEGKDGGYKWVGGHPGGEDAQAAASEGDPS
jgi:uncharacterized protein (DUF58 family)